VIHTVGPVWRGGSSGEERQLEDCYRASLELAEAYALRSIAFPAISCGLFGFPARQAASIAAREIRRMLAGARSVSTVLLVAFDAPMLAVLSEAVRDSE
jgi:O-acetyl-ADP-ribose deacetylase (regulator of RNase III)